MKNVRFLIRIIAMENAMRGYAPSEDIYPAWAGSDGGVMPWEAWFRQEKIQQRDVIEISELWLRELATVMIQDKKTETAEILTANANDSRGIATWVMWLDQQKQQDEVWYNLWSNRNTEIREMMQQNGKVMQVPVHKHYRNSAAWIDYMAYRYSAQDKKSRLEQASQWMPNQVLVYDNQDTGDVYFRGYHADITSQSISKIDITVWWLKGEIICKQADGKLVAYTWKDAEIAQYAAENGMTFEDAKRIYMWRLDHESEVRNLDSSVSTWKVIPMNQNGYTQAA
jgi:hypothetical protein